METIAVSENVVSMSLLMAWVAVSKVKELKFWKSGKYYALAIDKDSTPVLEDCPFKGMLTNENMPALFS